MHVSEVTELKIDQAIQQAAARNVPLPEPRVRRAIRLAAGVTQQELADALEKTRPCITRWENGSRTPRGWDRVAYAAALRRMQEAVRV